MIASSTVGSWLGVMVISWYIQTDAVAEVAWRAIFWLVMWIAYAVMGIVTSVLLAMSAVRRSRSL